MDCIYWKVKLRYIMKERGFIKFKLDTEFTSCYDSIVIELLDSYSDSNDMANVVIIVLAIAEGIIVFKRLYNSFKVLKQIKEQLENVDIFKLEYR